MVEWDGLENRCSFVLPRVRIPVSPPLYVIKVKESPPKHVLGGFFLYYCLQSKFHSFSNTACFGKRASTCIQASSEIIVFWLRHALKHEIIRPSCNVTFSPCHSNL